MDPTKLASEREQLRVCWAKLGGRLSAEWLANESEKLQRLRGSDIRQFHDKFGFKAKDTLKTGGLCAGAIFRTSAFINTENRSGSRTDQNIHIEHTVEIKDLVALLKDNLPASPSGPAALILKYSVATAMRKSQTDYLAGFPRSMSALNPRCRWFDQPFMRYERLMEHDDVWNVWTGEKVSTSFSFGDHLELLCGIFTELDFDDEIIYSLRLASPSKWLSC